MTEYNLMQQALAEQWQQLPKSLQAHYQTRTNQDVGLLSVDYPKYMQPILSMLGLFGVLISRKGKDNPTTVQKQMRGNRQYWQRTIKLPTNKEIVFKSVWVHASDNRIVEYVNPLLGLCMAVHVQDGMLFYQGKHFVLNLGLFRLAIPEWLLLGHTTIVEEAIDENHFQMDFRLTHPWFGQIYRYNGTFTTESL